MLPNPIFLNVHMYGVMIAVGLLVAFTILYPLGRKNGLSEKFLDFCFFNGLCAVMAGIGSAILFQAIYDYIENPELGFHLDSGMTFIGGLIGGVVFFLAVYFILRPRLNGRLLPLLPVAPCIITVAHAFGRVGCFFAGCCYGRETDSVFGVQFPRLLHKVHPTQLYEAFFLFALFGLLTFLCVKYQYRHNMSLYLVCYGIFRFFLEYVRGDDRGQFLGTTLSPSQFWSVCMVVLAIGLYCLLEFLYAKFPPAKVATAPNPTEE